MPTTTADLDDQVDNPTGIHRRTWRYVLPRAAREFIRDECVDSAAALTFFAVLSIFPALLASVAAVGVLGDGTAVVDRLLTLLGQVAPAAVVDTIRIPLTDAATSSTASVTLLVSILTALWSSSIYVSAFGRVMNRIYGVDEGRPYWKRKPAQLVVTVALIVLVVLIGAVLVSTGPIARAVGDLFGIGDTALTVWQVLRWPLLAAAVVMIIALLYKSTSNLRQPRFRWLSLGALLAIVVMGAASAGLATYVSYFADYNATFGALAGVVIFLIWLFLVNAALLIGAEFNAELQRGRQLQAGIAAEAQLQLPPRDTTMSEKTSRTAEVDRERGALLREGEQLPPRTDTALSTVRRVIRETWAKIRRTD